ncbi:hypothetical protein SASPL_109437 [Salvia splendens]|uniref:Uncharacterized protein n=1 Tax=Salvia splendens TaxID=180675 RepID=A0A8X8YKM7_SALSN|nr:hypothetical protein SASPL_109437 [Salvia splendens]
MSEKGIDRFPSTSESPIISSPSFLISSPPPPPSSPPIISPIPSILSSQSNPSPPSVYVPSSSSESDSPPAIPIDTLTSQPTHHMTTRAKAGIYKPKVFSLALSPNMLPRTALEAILIPIWKAAMLAEFIALLKNGTWILTTLPSANFIFGDSLVDAGNNNYIASLSKADFAPNGIDFGKPTGRFTNSRTIVDILGKFSDIFELLILLVQNA